MHRMSIVVLAVALACLQLSAADIRLTATRRPTPAATPRRAVTVRPPARTAPARATTRRNNGSSRFAGPCPPGQNGSWFDGCNWCTCPTDGGQMACTMMFCPGNYRTVAGCPSGKVPGDRWFENCNSFSCQRLPNGTLTTSGTVNGQCWSDNSRTTRTPTVRPTGGRGATAAGPCVTANSSWFDGCNWCTCATNGGPMACTLKYCPGNYRTVAGCPSGKVPGDRWFENCNSFSCERSSNGTLTTSGTVNGQCWSDNSRTTRTPTVRPTGGREATAAGPCITANSSWFDGCNWCTCATNGGPMACTLKYCPGNYRTVAGCPSGKVPGDRWFENCNSFSCERSSNGTLTTSGTVNGQCWSDNSRTTRTPTVRPTGGRGATAAGPCVTVNSSWYDGCNTCRCVRGEPTACTRRACFGHIQTIAGCPAGATPEQSWYANCNRYTCASVNGTLVTRHTTGGHCW